MVRAGLRATVLDPVGVWWGVRSGDEPLDVIILGGKHADIEIGKEDGEIIAEIIANSNRSFLIDLSHFRKGEMVRFVTDFAENLYRINRVGLHLFIDEADAFAPQKAFGDENRMLGAMEDIVRRGRARGLGVTMITQRPAVLNKNVLTQIELLILLRVVSPQDRAAIRDWVSVHGTKDEQELLFSELQALPIGTAFFWSPGWLECFEKVAVDKITTFDSSATPKPGQVIEIPELLQATSVGDIQERLAANKAPEEEKPASNGPWIAELTGLRDEVRMLRASQEETKQKIREWYEFGLRAFPYLTSSDMENSEKWMERYLEENRPTEPLRDEPPLSLRSLPEITAEEQTYSGLTITQPLVRIVTAACILSKLKLPVNKETIAIMAGLSKRGGTYGKNLADLTKHQVLERSADGFVVPSSTAEIYTPTEVQDPVTLWKSKLPLGQWKIVNYLMQYPDTKLSKLDIGHGIGTVPTGGTFGANISELKKLGLISGTNSGLTLSPIFKARSKK